MESSNFDKFAMTLAAELAARLELHFTVQPTLTLADAARALGVSDETVRNWCDKGEIPNIRVGKFYRIKPADINTFLERHYHHKEARA